MIFKGAEEDDSLLKKQPSRIRLEDLEEKY